MYETIVTTFTTTAAQEDILTTQTTIRQRLCERLGITDDELTTQLTNKQIAMTVVVFFSGANRVSINNHYWQSAIEDSVYPSGLIYPQSIKIETITTGKVMITIN